MEMLGKSQSQGEDICLITALVCRKSRKTSFFFFFFGLPFFFFLLASGSDSSYVSN